MSQKQIKITAAGVFIRGTVREKGTVIDVADYAAKLTDDSAPDIIHEPVAVRLIATGKAEAVKAPAKEKKSD